MRPTGTTLPCAVATMSMWPTQAQVRAMRKKAINVPAMTRPKGDAGVSMISTAAGRNSSSDRRDEPNGRTLPMVSSADFMESSLHAVEGGVAPTSPDQVIVAAILDDAAAFNRNDAVGTPDGREAVRDHQ